MSSPVQGGFGDINMTHGWWKCDLEPFCNVSSFLGCCFFKTKNLLTCSSTFGTTADGNESTSVKEYIFQNVRMLITALFSVAKYMGP